jgi:siderophore synthetase component
VAYCLFVNHVSGVLGVLADRDPGAERRLWSRVRCALESFRRDHGDAPQLRAVLAGVPLPAKTNLLTRWRRDADRDSGYVPVSLPLGPATGDGE